MWVRGLKLSCLIGAEYAVESHPMWVRGLKHKLNAETLKVFNVAPYVGAWIETA